jgi:CRP-like cAMP-binding protein
VLRTSKGGLVTRRRIIALESDDRALALSRVPILSSLPSSELDEIASRSHVLAFSDGDVIVPEGEEGLGFYLILNGRCRVVRDGVQIAELHTGDFFGEISLLEGTPRNATVIADGETTCAGMLRQTFKGLLVRNPRLALRILDEEARRSGLPLA